MTDSAAAATAFATGHKTFNGGIGVDANGKTVRTLLESARKQGKATGLVTTSQVTDATPAAYAAHVKDRAQQSEIARQFLEVSKPDVILGGGEDYWYPAGNAGALPDHPPTDPTEASKGDKGNLVEKAKSLGYEYVGTRDIELPAGLPGATIVATGKDAPPKITLVGPKGERITSPDDLKPVVQRPFFVMMDPRTKLTEAGNGTASARFTPAPGAGETRKIIAIVEGRGEYEVASYRAPGVKRPGRVQGLKATRHRITWRDGGEHEVRVSTRDGRRVIKRVGKRALTVHNARTVSVRKLANGLAGPFATKRIR